MSIRNRLFTVLAGLSLLLLLAAGLIIVSGFDPISDEIVALSDETENVQHELEQSLDSLEGVFLDQVRESVGQYSALFKETVSHDIVSTAEIAAGIIYGYSRNQLSEAVDLLSQRFKHRGFMGVAAVDDGEVLFDSAKAPSLVQKGLAQHDLSHDHGAVLELKAPLAGAARVFFIKVGESTSLPILEMTLRLDETDDDKHGAALFFSLDEFIAACFGWTPEGHVRNVVTTSDGRVVAHPDASLVGKPYAAVFPSQIEYYIVRKEVLPGQLVAYTFGLKDPSDARLRILKTLDQSIHSRSVRTEALSGVVAESIVSMRYELLAIAVTFLAIAMVVAVFISNRISRPIKDLTDTAKVVARGELDIVVDPANRGGAEIESLARNFERMRVALKGQIDNLDELVDDRTRELAIVNANLMEAKNRAEEASKAKGDFLAMMSHEIRTPMNSIIGFADILWENDLPPLQKSCVEMVRASSELLLHIINDILDFSKIEAQQVKIVEIDFDLRDLIEESARIMGPSAHQKGVDIVVSFAPDMPEQIVGDPTHIRQILLNLLGNAVKFSNEGEIIVGIKTDDSRSNFELSVSDQGIGIPAEKLPTIFDPFTQSDSTITRQFGGTGLGLTICKRLSSLMGGTVAARSTEQEGSIFSIFLPLKIVADESLVKPEMFLTGQDVFIASASNNLTEVVSSFVEQWGGRPAAGHSVDDLRYMDVGKYAAMIVDEKLEGGSGVEVIEGLVANDYVIPPTILMAEAMTGMRISEVLNSHAPHVCLKPSRKRCLKRSLMACVEESGAVSVQEEIAGTLDLSRPLRLLLAEDSESNRNLFSLYLEGTGALVDMVHDGHQALEMFRKNAYDIVLMDMEMPVMDGFEASEKIREYEKENGAKQTPLYALTAHAFNEYRERCALIGCNGYLTKPIKKHDFLRILFG